MKSTAPDDLPTHPDALREMVLRLLREREEKDAEHARQLAEQQRLLNQKDWCLTLRDETIARLEMTIAKLKRWRLGQRSEKLSHDQILFLLAHLPQR